MLFIQVLETFSLTVLAIPETDCNSMTDLHKIWHHDTELVSEVHGC